MARPIEYTKEIGDNICDQLASGKSLRSICLSDDMPDRHTVIQWVLNHNNDDILSGFSTQYTHAREIQYETMLDELPDIADDGSNDYITKERNDGSEYDALNSENIQRSRLRIDTRLNIIERMRPKKYGKLNQHDHTSKGESLNAPTAEQKATAKKNILDSVKDD